MSEILTEIKKQRLDAMKNKDTVLRGILTTLVGEIETIASRNTKPITDDIVGKVVKKFRDGAQEMFKINADASIENEISVYETFIPVTLSVDEIIAVLYDNSKVKITEAKSDGMATGIAVGILKRGGHAVDGRDVSHAVKSIRESFQTC
tara:strand:+ start:393 stop:839 length:447 start_codon:yes stop_codon:yes gene_type:complete